MEFWCSLLELLKKHFHNSAPQTCAECFPSCLFKSFQESPTRHPSLCLFWRISAVWHAVFTVYVSSLKEGEQQAVKARRTFRSSHRGHWNKRLSGSGCWPLWWFLRSDMTVRCTGLTDWRLLTASPAGQVKPPNWDCSRETAFVDLQRPCDSVAECWWYKCHNERGEMEKQGLPKGCQLQHIVRKLKWDHVTYLGLTCQCLGYWDNAIVANVVFFLLLFLLGTSSSSTDSSTRWVTFQDFAVVFVFHYSWFLGCSAGGSRQFRRHIVAWSTRPKADGKLGEVSKLTECLWSFTAKH